jgi:hypothetical protein
MSVNGEVLKVGETMTITTVNNNDDVNGVMISNPKWLPINSGIDFSSHLPEAYLEMVSRKEYEVLKKKINRVNNYLDDVLKYNATADLKAVIGVIKDILNEKNREQTSD